MKYTIRFFKGNPDEENEDLIESSYSDFLPIVPQIGNRVFLSANLNMYKVKRVDIVYPGENNGSYSVDVWVGPVD